MQEKTFKELADEVIDAVERGDGTMASWYQFSQPIRAKLAAAIAYELAQQTANHKCARSLHDQQLIERLMIERDTLSRTLELRGNQVDTQKDLADLKQRMAIVEGRALDRVWCKIDTIEQQIDGLHKEDVAAAKRSTAIAEQATRDRDDIARAQARIEHVNESVSTLAKRHAGLRDTLIEFFEKFDDAFKKALRG